MKSPQPSLKLVPHKYSQYYFDEVDQHRLVWQPLSKSGLSVLNQEATYVFDLIDGKLTLGDIFKKCQQIDKSVTKETLDSILTQLESAQIIAYRQPLNQSITLDDPTTLGVWLHTTNQCNLRCTYCYVRKSAEFMDEAASKRHITRIMKSAKKHGFTTVKIKFTGGEVLLRYEQAIAMVEYGYSQAKDLGLKFVPVFLTNAVLLNPEKAQHIKQLGIKVMVSLDGLKVHHDAVRVFPSGSGTFAFVMKGIEALRQAEVEFNLSVTVTDKNVTGIPELTSFLLDKKIPFVLNFFRENCQAGSEMTSANYVLITELRKAYRIIEDRMPSESVISGLLDRVTFGSPHLNACGVGRNYLVVDQNGRIASCQIEIDRTIGSLNDKEDPIDTMINGSFLEPRTLTVDQKKPCQSCPWRYICGGGCPLLTHSVKGRYDRNSPYCEVYKALIPDLLRLEAKRIIGKEKKDRKANKEN